MSSIPLCFAEIEILPHWLPIWIFLLVCPALVGTAIMLYGPDRRSLSRTKGWLLTGLRLFAFLMVWSLVAGLASVEEVERREPGEVMVILDTSPSMDLYDPHSSRQQLELEAAALGIPLPAANGNRDIQDAFFGATRLGLAQRALGGGWIAKLAKAHRVSLHSVNDVLESLEPDVGRLLSTSGELERVLDRIRISGKTTDLGAPVVEAVMQREPATVAGIVLFTDGNHHGASDPLQAARTLSALSVPLFAVGVGAENKPKDIAVVDVHATGEHFSGDEIQIEVALDSVGFGKSRLTLQVTGEEDLEIKRFELELPGVDGISRWPLDIPAGPPGRRRLTVSYPPVEGEASPENNSRHFWIDVQSEKARVLFLDGGPRWEYRYLKTTWERDDNVDLSFHLVSPPPDRRLPPEFPRGQDQLFAYDVIVIGDVDASLFTHEEKQLLANFVSARGGSLVLVAGQRSMPYSWAFGPLASVLPVQLLHPLPPRDLGAQLARTGPRFVLTADGERSSVLRLAAGLAKNLELWEKLPPPLWISPLAGIQPGSTLLASLDLPSLKSPEDSNGSEKPKTADPRAAVFVSRAVGTGKVFYSGIDATWKWRYRFGDMLYRRFWGQLIRWAVADRLTSRDTHVRLGTDKLVYEFPDRVVIEAVVEKGPESPLVDGLIDAVVTGRNSGDDNPVSTRVRLEHVPQSSGRYQGNLEGASLMDLVRPLSGDPSGRAIEFQVELDIADLPNYEQLPGKAQATFLVERRSQLETQDLAVNRSLLEDLARLSGGAYLPFAEFQKVAGKLPDRSRTSREISTRSVTDFPVAVAVAFLSLVVLEWILRKRWKLL